MRLKEFVREQAPLAPATNDQLGMQPMDQGLDATQAVMSKSQLKHKQLHDKQVQNKDVPAIVALKQIQQKIEKNKLEPRISIDTVLDQLGNALRTDYYTADALRDLSDRNPAVKNVVKNIEPDAVIFKTSDSDNLAPSNSHTQGNPQQTVSSMANKALKRRLK